MLTCAFGTCNAKRGESKTLPGPELLQEISTSVKTLLKQDSKAPSRETTHFIPAETTHVA